MVILQILLAIPIIVLNIRIILIIALALVTAVQILVHPRILQVRVLIKNKEKEMLVEQLLNENLEKSLYLHLKSSKYLDIYLKQDINSCLLEHQQY